MDVPLFRFVIVGLVNTLVSLLLIYGCKWLIGMGDIAANMVGYGVGMMCGFLLNKRWTFGHSGELVPAFLRYVAVLASAYLLNLMTVLFAIHNLRLNEYLAQALGIFPYTTVTFFGSRFFAFRKI